ncbi:MAG: O-antigen ligase family protein [Ferruginibacter sp.]
MRLGFILAGLGVLLFFASLAYYGNKRSTYLLFVIYFLPFVDLWVTPSSLGNLSVFDFITFVSAAIFFKDISSVTRGNRFYVFVFVLFFLLMLFGSIASEFVSWSLIHIPPILTPFIYAALLMRELRENDLFLHRLIAALKTTALVGVFFVLMQMLVGVGFTHYDTLNTNVLDSSGTRYPGFFMDAQVNGVFMSMTGFLFLINFSDPSKPVFKNYWQFGLLVGAAVMAGSRSPLMGFAAGIVFLILFVGGRFRPTFLVFAIIAAMLIFLFSDNIIVFKRFGQVSDSLDFRASLWADAWRIYYKEYVLGIGVENYQQYITLHSQDQFLMLDNDEIAYLMQPENGYLKWLVEFGLFGTSLLFIMILAPMLRVIYNFVNGHKIVLLFFFIAPIVAWFISFTSLYTLYDKRIVILLVTYLVILATYPFDITMQHQHD